jgi:hypothetical protein
MRKPSIHRYAGYDLYIAPIEELNPATQSLQTELRLNQVQEVGRYRVRFEGLRTENAESLMQGGGGAVTADLVLTDTAGVEHRISPQVRIHGGQESHPGELPSGLGRVELLGMQVDQKKVRLGFRGPGLPEQVEVTRGEPRDLGAARVEFTGFRVPDAAGMQQGIGTVFADLQVTPRGGRPAPVAPSISIAPPKDEIVPARLPDGEGEVKLADMQAEKNVVKLDWSNVPGMPGPPPTLAVEVTLKPLIVFFWLGTALVSLGFLLSLVRRGREWGRAA